MIESPGTPLIAWVSAIGALVHGCLAVFYVRTLSRGVQPQLFIAALLLGAVGFSMNAAAYWTGGEVAHAIATRLDAARIVAWTAFLSSVITGFGTSHAPPDAKRRFARLVLLGMLLGAIAMVETIQPLSLAPSRQDLMPLLSMLALAIFGLTLGEQIIRRTQSAQWWSMKPLWIGMTGMFAYDLLAFAGAIVSRRIDMDLWAVRGLVVSLTVIIASLASARTAGWQRRLVISRNAALQFTSLFLIGAVLLAIAAAGAWVQKFGGNWGGPLSIASYFLAVMALASLAMSGRLRSLLRVWIAKNLFTHRYDYRDEWLRFTSQIASRDPLESPNQKIIRAIADLVESTGGSLWLKHEQSFQQVACLDSPSSSVTVAQSAELPVFLGARRWVVDVAEWKQWPDRYEMGPVPGWLDSLAGVRLIVPLVADDALTGIVLLNEPRAPLALDWEVRDILKTAASQAAMHLAEMRARSALVEAEKFDAFNRMSAFVVHDLKNLIAQLDLMTRNAERHRGNPQFQADMLETVRHSVARMQRLMLQLRSGAVPTEAPRMVDLGEVARRVFDDKRRIHPDISLEIETSSPVIAHEDRLVRVIGHVVQNSIDASSMNSATISMRVWSDAPFGKIEVRDRGAGMSGEFVADRLFRPFQSTKEHGMGIGMFESQQYLQGIGGRIEVESDPGLGTCCRIIVPLGTV